MPKEGMSSTPCKRFNKPIFGGLLLNFFLGFETTFKKRNGTCTRPAVVALRDFILKSLKALSITE